MKRRQSEGRFVGPEMLPGVRLEREYAQGGTYGIGTFTRPLNDGLMAPMHAVEVTDGDDRAITPVRGDLIPTNPHEGGV